jgi:hypothetical protein
MLTGLNEYDPKIIAVESSGKKFTGDYIGSLLMEQCTENMHACSCICDLKKLTSNCFVSGESDVGAE